jgi:hypothetical protein
MGQKSRDANGGRRDTDSPQLTKALDGQFVSRHILLRRSEILVCGLIFVLGIAISGLALDGGVSAEMQARELEFTSVSRAVSASLEARLHEAFAATDLIGFLASNANNSTAQVLLNLHRHADRLQHLPHAEQYRWIVVVQKVRASERAKFEADINTLREAWVPEWANRTEDKRITYMHSNRTFYDAPDGVDLQPIIMRMPRSERSFLWDTDNFDEVSRVVQHKYVHMCIIDSNYSSTRGHQLVVVLTGDRDQLIVRTYTPR